MVASNGSHRGFLATARDALRSAISFISVGSGYDAVKEKNKRQAPTGLLRSEDAELLPNDRRKLLSASRDLHRNFSLAAWMIRRHLDYVSSFSFQYRSGNPALDGRVERLMRWFSQPSNCDVTGRFSLAKIVRMAEMRRITTGASVDVYWNGGVQYKVTVGTVVGTAVPIDLGLGDNLPAEDTAVVVSLCSQINVDIDGDNRRSPVEQTRSS